MKLRSPISVPLAFLLFLLFSGSAIAQQTVRMPDKDTRTPLQLPEGISSVYLCDLVPGNTYELLLNGVFPGKRESFLLRLAAPDSLTILPSAGGSANALRFIAASECTELLVEARSDTRTAEVPALLSMFCENNLRLPKKTALPDAANMSVQSGILPASLITNTLIGGNCFEVSNITSSGPVGAFGTFSNGLSSIGIQNGMVLCTDDVSILPGPNLSSGGTNQGQGFNIRDTLGDPDLATLTTGDQWDVITLEFDFTPTANTVQFEYVFGSEEYCEFSSVGFNDVFGFFISGPGISGTQNLAVLPNTTTPISAGNVNNFTNNQYFNSNDFTCLPFFPQNILECELDGWTDILTATANVIPCSTYHIKLAIADIIDGGWASAVFLRANSFNAGGSVTAEAVYPGNLPAAYEGCGNGAIRFSRDNSDTSAPITVNFTVSGSATSGDDYTPIFSPVVIPVGATEVFLPIDAFADQLPEGQENIVLLLDAPCSCDQAEVEYLIQDQLSLEVDLADQTACEGNLVLLSPMVNGGLPPYSYLWNTGETDSSILVATAGTYTVVVTDSCGTMVADSAVVELLPATLLSTNISFCFGDSVSIGGEVYTSSDTITLVFPGMNGSCDTIFTYFLQAKSVQNLTDTIIFCAGDTIHIGGIGYTASGIVLDTLPGQDGGCDTMLTYVLSMLERPVLSDTLQFCAGSSVTIGGNVYTAAGTVLDTIPGQNGSCDTLATYTLQVLPLNTRSETLSFCSGDSVLIGGQAYYQPGLVNDTIPASSGCDTVVTYTLKYLTPAPSVVKIICPADVSVSTVAPTPVVYPIPQASTDCPCPGIAPVLTEGLPSGSIFPDGLTKVCYAATDSCGNTASCCFEVRIDQSMPCDVKEFGCIKFELLSVTKDPKENKTFRFRLTNKCPNPMVYAAFQLLDGQVALEPANGALYTAPSGRSYLVRNPNYSPFYSIRFSTFSDPISNGMSEIFEYTIPPQIKPTYIHTIVKLAESSYYEAYMNTFNCPVGITPNMQQPLEPRNEDALRAGLQVFPNPTNGVLFADLSAWSGEQLWLQVYDSRGRRVLQQQVAAGDAPQEIRLPEGLSDGLYQLDVKTPDGGKQVVRFVIQH